MSVHLCTREEAAAVGGETEIISIRITSVISLSGCHRF